MTTFLLALAGRAVSLAGSKLAVFGLGVWLYRRTGSATVYGLATLAMFAPRPLLGPAAGLLVDRWGGRAAMAAGHACAGVCSVALAALFAAGALGPASALALLTLVFCFDTVEYPAFSALTARLVPPARLERATALTNVALGLTQVAAPAAAGALLELAGLGPILAFDAASFVLAALVLIALRLPKAAASGGADRARPSQAPAPAAAPMPSNGPAGEAEAPRPRALSAPGGGAGAGWRYVRAERGLASLLLLLAVASFNLTAVQVLLGPLVLGFAGARELGVVQSAAGVGFVVGGVASLTWRGPRQKVDGVLGALLAQGLVLLLAAAPPSLPLACAAAFGAAMTMPVVGSLSEAIWLRRVPSALQGRVAAARDTTQATAMLAASASAGPALDRLLEPLMAPGGALAPWLGPLIGVGPGRGAALAIAAVGASTAACALLGFASASLRGAAAD
ncbi:MAG TPA: MFS transporter [Polyangiaceae bacterium]|nr:MFS transporter [Polyangiaceae bacterium]